MNAEAARMAVQALAFESARQDAVLAALRATLPPATPLDAQQACWPALTRARLRTDASGLRAYQVNARATAQRVLLDHFPTLAAMLGEDALQALAMQLWDAQPPSSGDLGEWGAALPSLLAQHPDLQAWPWLADCASLDWARHRCLRAADAALDANSLQRLGDTAPEQLQLVLQPCVQVVHSVWPVEALWVAHQLEPAQQAQAASEALAQVNDKQAVDDGQTVVVWRHPWQVQMSTLDEDSGWWMRALALARPEAASTANTSLATLLDQAPAGFDFSAWLTTAVAQGWLWQVRC